MEPFISKHDPRAYAGKMDRFGVSKLLEDIHNQGYEYMEESEAGQEILNVAHDFANKKIRAYIDYMRIKHEGQGDV